MLHQHHLHRRTRMSFPISQTEGAQCQFKASRGAAEKVYKVWHLKQPFVVIS